MSLKQAFFKPAARGALALALLAASHAACALGLGEIRVMSQPGQPLLAEIPVISSEPGELEQLRARLASPVIFERVGLARPSGLVSQLDFAVALSSDGKPVIRVTSAAPVDMPAVNFLIEVDWGQGRLVREYSALVGAPGAVAAAGQPQIQAPTPAPSNRIEAVPQRAQPLPPPVAEAPASAPAEPPAENAPTPAIAATPPSPPPALEPPPTPTPRPAPAIAAPTASSSGSVTVARGQTLSQIARSVQQSGTLDQTMIALLQANPQAFIGNNINRLRAGATLRMPTAEETEALASAEASAMVRRQISDWRQVRAPVPQPAGNTPAAPLVAGAAKPARAADARLEIAPPVANATQRAGTTSGTQAGGEGDMLAEQQLRQSREDLAARSAEVAELKTRVAELEKLKDQQSKLIAMKDSDLAAAQKRLADSQGAAAAGAPAWWWIGLALVVGGLLAWVGLRGRRGPRPTPVYRGPLEAPAPDPVPVEPVAAAAAEPEAPPAQAPAPAAAPASEPAAPRYTPSYAGGESRPGPVESPTPAPGTPAWMSPTAKPTWHTVDGPHPIEPRISPTVVPIATAAQSRPVPRPSPAVTPVPAPAARQADPVVPIAPPAASGRERLELAIAYLDLGDTEAARALLQQVSASDDPHAREEAGRLLRALG
jgi:pilus assembly protein FimV